MRRTRERNRQTKAGRMYVFCSACGRLREVRTLRGIEGDVHVYYRCFKCRGAARRPRPDKYGA